MTLLASIAWVLAILVALAAAYRAVFSIAYLVTPHRQPPPAAGEDARRFAVLIPAHDEELLIDAVIRTIRAADYPQDRITIHVIADNCTDGTADRVRALGEQVHERHDPENPGKGQAIDWMLSRLDLAAVDAVALFDADILVEPEFFLAMNRELLAGRRCLQGYYGIANPGESTLTRLLAATYVMKNLLFNAGKERLGLSVLLMGTGMVFRNEILAESGWQAMSIGEDLEQSFQLIARGERIHFVEDAVAHAQEATSLKQGTSQRQRWATGRRALNARARLTIARGLRTGSIHEVDAGLDLLMPSYSKLLNWTALALVASALAAPISLAPACVSGAALAWQIAEVAVAMRIMGTDARVLASLAFAPVFLVWKGGIDLLAVAGYRRNAWTRTERQSHAEARPDDPDAPPRGERSSSDVESASTSGSGRVRPPGSRGTRALKVLALAALLTVGAELALRAWAHHLRVAFEEFDVQTGTYRLVPGTYPSSSGGEIRINAAGLRGPPLAERTRERVRIVALGDSCTFGADREDRTWPALMQAALDDAGGGPGRYEVLNAGVAGADSGDALRRFESVVAPIEPDVVVIYVGWNDLMKLAPLSQRGGSAIARLSRWIDRLWLVRGARKVAFFHLRTALTAPDVGRESRTGRFETFVPGRFAANLEALVSAVQANDSIAILVTLATPLREGMSASLVRKRGIFFPFFLGGDRVGDFLDLIDAYNRTIESVAESAGAPVVDLAGAIEAMPNPMPYFWDTMHANHRGQALTANVVRAALVRSRVVRNADAGALP